MMNVKGRADAAQTCMLNIFREYSRPITRMTANQFGAAFLGIALQLAISDTNLTLVLCTSIFSVLFLLYLNHTVIWEEGAKSRIRVDAGREKYNPLTGLWIGVAASLPNIILGVIVALTYFCSRADGPLAWEWTGNINGIANVIARIWQGMYLGILTYIDAGNHYLLLLTPLPVILFSLVSYWLGLKQWTLAKAFKLKKK